MGSEEEAARRELERIAAAGRAKKAAEAEDRRRAEQAAKGDKK